MDITRKPVVRLCHSPNLADKLRWQRPPLSESRNSALLASSEHDPSQLHRRNNRGRKIESQSGKENIAPPILQSGKTHAAKARRSVLVNVNNVNHGGSESLHGVPFAGSTSVESPSRKVGNGEPGDAGLRFEVDGKPFLDTIDVLGYTGPHEDHWPASQGVSPLGQEPVITQDSFVPIVIETIDHAPFPEILASFNDIFSSSFTSPVKSSGTGDDSPNPFLFSLLPSPPLPTSVKFNFSTLADSVSQLTGDIAASIAARYEGDYLYHDQYHEDAVARDEKFHWEEEMKCLEIQCGL